MTFKELKSFVYEDCGYQSSPAAAVQARIERYLYEAIQSIIVEPDLRGLIDSNGPVTFVSVAGRPRYALHDAVVDMLCMTDRTNDRVIAPMPLSEYRRRDPDPTDTSGSPTHYVSIGYSPVEQQPSVPSRLFAKSTSASDGTGQRLIQMVVIVSGGYRRSVTSIALNGTTPIDVSGAANLSDIIAVEDFHLTTAAAGTVTLHEGSGTGPELARVQPTQHKSRYIAFYLYPTPNAPITYYVDYRGRLDKPLDEDDEPPIPTDWHPMLIKYAAFREWELKDDTRAQIARSQYNHWLSRLKYRLHDLGTPVMGGGREPGRSRLGGTSPPITSRTADMLLPLLLNGGFGGGDGGTPTPGPSAGTDLTTMFSHYIDALQDAQPGEDTSTLVALHQPVVRDQTPSELDDLNTTYWRYIEETL